MKYLIAFLAWSVGTVVIGGLLSVFIPETDPPLTGLVTAVVCIGVGIWVKRLLSQGVFGD